MYSGSGYSDWEIGDIDVFIHHGHYHLFHLIIPNHDYIAHAISKDGISWKRVKNAIFVGHPGEWDDDMLWTMQVSIHRGKFRMYYTGLQRKDKGKVQKIGFAESENLLDWEKCTDSWLPIESAAPYYETLENNPREWLSFRDPFLYQFEENQYLLMCARASDGPTSRRGCVGVYQLSEEGFLPKKPLVFPMVYDDIECPCVFQFNNRFYLLGSIREDIKVRYWFAPELLGEYHSFHPDVLLPQGNYAARVVKDGDQLLLYSFFFMDGRVNSLRVLPPPKQLDTDPEGRLILKSYYRWEKMIHQTIKQPDFIDFMPVLSNPTANYDIQSDQWTCSSKSGYELFSFQKPSPSFIWEGILTVEGMGKFGLLTDLDEEGNGYFISFDIIYGLVQIRAWGFNSSDKQHNFVFKNIQSSGFNITPDRSFHFKLIRYGNYIELSINGIVKLTLIDYTYGGPRLGLYTASSIISLRKSTIKVLTEPENEYASQSDALDEQGVGKNG